MTRTLINAIALATFTHSLAILAVGPSIYAEFPPTIGKQTILVDHAVDGDTVRGYYLVPFAFRLYGCNAPEKDTDAGKAATEALSRMVPAGSITTVELMGRDKYYGRVLAKFRTLEGGDVATQMIGAGHAKPWDGKGPRP